MSSNISSMLQFWKNFNLVQLQRDLDVNATELANRQDASDASRRKLVEQSKEFKKSTPEDVRKSVAPLLRSFQSEIDALSKRSKACEADFLNLYKKLVEMPDPVVALEQAESFQRKAQKMTDIETENQKLRETLAEYNKEFAEVKNQEVTIKNLRERIREFEKNTESRAKQMTLEMSEQLEKHFTEKEKNLQETQLLIATKLGEAEQTAVTFKAALDASQAELFDIKSKYDEEIAAKQAELDLLLGDVEKSTQRAASAEKELEQLKEQMAKDSVNAHDRKKSSSAMEEAIEVLSRSSLESELASKEKEISQLVEDIQHLQGSMGKLRDSSAGVIAKLEEELSQKNNLCQELQAQLEERDDYEEIKRELQIIKSTEFSSLDTSEEKQDGGRGGTSNAKSLEMLLLEKNRAQQSGNTALRAANSQLTERCDLAEQENKEALLKIDQQQQLIRQLEKDLLVVQGGSSPPNFRPAADGAPNPVPAMSTELVAGAVQQSSSIPPDEKSASSSLLAIVTSQRERFRVRNQELEAENYMLQQNYNRMQNELDSMRSDNVKLYEKIKFLQSYPTTKVQVDDVTAKRYSSQYEDNLDPFATFNKRERQRKYMNLSPHDKVTLNVGKFILSSKLARTIFFFYMLIVHCLLYIILYKYAYTEDCMRHIAELCYEKFGQQMVPNHLGGAVGGSDLLKKI